MPTVPRRRPAPGSASQSASPSPPPFCTARAWPWARPPCAAAGPGWCAPPARGEPSAVSSWPWPAEAPMIPGEVFPADGDIELNLGSPTTILTVANAGDRPIQVGSHYHFAETNPALRFGRKAAWGLRLDAPSGSAVRFEPGQAREVTLVPFKGARRAIGFRGDAMGDLS